MTYAGPEECAVPRALETAEIARLCADYAHAAANAKAAAWGRRRHSTDDQFINIIRIFRCSTRRGDME